MGKKPGSYLGTEIEGKWWKRYREAGFFARGNGEWWIENGALCFRRQLTRTPLVIPFDEVTGEKASVVILFGAPSTESTLHLRILSDLARILKDKKNRKILLKEKNADTLLRCFSENPDEHE
mgnify:CR=1 FL=1